MALEILPMDPETLNTIIMALECKNNFQKN